jgi:hypothetical protein
VSRAASPLSAPVGAVHTSGRYVTTKTGRGCGYCGPPRPEGGTSLGVAALPCVRPGGPRQCSLIPAEYFKGRGFHWMRIRDDVRARQWESSALPPATWCSRGWGSLGRDVTDARDLGRRACLPWLSCGFDPIAPDARVPHPMRRGWESGSQPRRRRRPGSGRRPAQHRPPGRRRVAGRQDSLTGSTQQPGQDPESGTFLGRRAATPRPRT